MLNLKKIINSEFIKKQIDFKNNKWHLNIPNQAGWYYIETDTPLEILLQISSPPATYINIKGETKKCRNYDIPSRTEVLVGSLISDDIVIENGGIRAVYSGMATNLLSRAREHTFGHEGTAALALYNYPELKSYEWFFKYKVNTLDFTSDKHRNVTLKLGEEIWRANNGWPILCSG